MKEVLFENIYNEHKNVVYNLCLHYGLTKEDAQDDQMMAALLDRMGSGDN